MNVHVHSKKLFHAKVNILAASEMWNGDHTARDIAKRFNVTKSVIIGIASRNRALFPMKKQVSIRDPHAAKRPYKAREVKSVADTDENLISPTEYDHQRAPFTKQLHELSSCECRWPLNNGGPFLFCAAEAATSTTYCAHHTFRSSRAKNDNAEGNA